MELTPLEAAVEPRPVVAAFTPWEVNSRATPSIVSRGTPQISAYSSMVFEKALSLR